MSMVQFAMLCDKCQRRSPEYESWPSCRECMEDACSNCDIPQERRLDENYRTLCKECAEELAHDENQGRD